MARQIAASMKMVHKTQNNEKLSANEGVCVLSANGRDSSCKSANVSDSLCTVKLMDVIFR